MEKVIDLVALTRLTLDLQKLLIDVGALEGNDSRVLHAVPSSQSSSFPSRKTMPAPNSADDDEWA